jgi:glucose/arabinose dehydrogenase
MFEEVNIIVNGGNYGWNLREGYSGFDPKNPLKTPDTKPEKDAEGRPFVDPILIYKNAKGFQNDPDAGGTSITGGYVYRGKAIPHLTGKYIFGDWSRSWTKVDGAVYVATPPASGTRWTREALALASHPEGKLNACVVAFGENADGEIYVMTNDNRGLIGETGKVYKLVAW